MERRRLTVVDISTVLGVVSGLSVLIPGIVLLTRFRKVKAIPLRNMTVILASFAVLHGLYHISALAGLTDLAFFLDFLTSVILVVLAVYYTHWVIGSGLFLLAVSDISGSLRNFVPVMLVVALVLFARLAVRSKSLSSLQSQLSIFLMIWIAAELLRALLNAGVITATPALQLLGFEIHTLAMVAFGVFLLFRFYRVASHSKLLPADWLADGSKPKGKDEG
jgi:hypothetical protein